MEIKAPIELEYRSRERELKTVQKCGQLKLLFSEILFILTKWDRKAVPNPVLVYVGAAPGVHIISLLELFPEFRFVLYDPRDFDERVVRLAEQPGARVKIRQQFFEDADAQDWKDREDVFFVSDIRTVGPVHTKNEVLEEFRSAGRRCGFAAVEAETEKRIEAGVAKNMRDQETWVFTIQPVEALLKFRLPYVKPGAKAELFLYLGGAICYQPFVGASSTETRLIPERVGCKFVQTEWDPKGYESGCFYHNAVTREVAKFAPPAGGEALLGGELHANYDGVVAVFLLKAYLTRSGADATRDAVTALYWKIMGVIGGSLAERYEAWLAKFRREVRNPAERTGDRYVRSAQAAAVSASPAPKAYVIPQRRWKK